MPAVANKAKSSKKKATKQPDHLYARGFYMNGLVLFLCIGLTQAQDWTEVKPEDNHQPLVADLGADYYKGAIVSHGGLTKETDSAPKIRRSTVYSLDLDTNVLTTKIVVAGPPRAYHESRAIGDILVSFGGKCGGDPTVNKGYCNDLVLIDMKGWTSTQYCPIGSKGKDWCVDTNNFNTHWVDGPAPELRYAHASAAGPTPRQKGETKVTHFYVYAGAGLDGNLADLWAFDMATLQWSELATTDMPPAVASPRIAIADGHFYVFGGKDARGFYGNTMFRLDLATLVWTSDQADASKLKPMGRQYHTMMPYAGYLVMMGGGIKNPATGEKTFWNDLWVYELATQQWVELRATNVEEGRDMPMVRWCHTLMAGDDGTFYIHGRSSNEGFDNDYWSYTHQPCDPSCQDTEGKCFLGTCACQEGCTHTFFSKRSGCKCTSIALNEQVSPIKFGDTQIGATVLQELGRQGKQIVGALQAEIEADFQFQELLTQFFMSVPFETVSGKVFNLLTDPDVYWKSQASFVAFARRIPSSLRASWEANCTARLGGSHPCQIMQLSSDDWSAEATVPAQARTFYEPIEFLSMNPTSSGRRLGSSLGLRTWTLQGFDLLSDPSRLAALDRASKSGRRTLSQRVMMTKQTSVANYYGVSIYYPLYTEVSKPFGFPSIFTAYRTTPGGTEAFRLPGKVQHSATVLGEYSTGELFERVMLKSMKSILEMQITQVQFFLFDASAASEPANSFLAAFDPSPAGDAKALFETWAMKSAQQVTGFQHVGFTELQWDASSKWLLVLAANLPCPPDTIFKDHGVCLKCPEGYQCPGMLKKADNGLPLRDTATATGIPADGMVKPGYWVSASAPMSVYLCSDSVACTGGLPGSCGANFEGKLCSACVDDYYRSGIGPCEPCKDNWLIKSGLVYPVSLAPWLLLLVLLIVLFYALRGKTSRKATSMVCCAAAAGMMVSFFQILSIASLMNVKFPDLVMPLMDLASLMLFDVDTFGFRCSIGRDDTLHYALRVMIFFWGLVAVFLCFMVSKPLSKMSGGKMTPWKDTHAVNCAGQFMQMSFITMVAIGLLPLNCYLHPNGERSIRSYPGTICWSDDHPAMILPGLYLLALAGGFITATSFSLWSAPSWVGKMTHRIEATGFLMGRFNMDVWWWAIPLMLRGVALSLVVVLIPDDGHGQVIYTCTILIIFMALELRYFPWKTPTLNLLDCAICGGMACVMVTSTVFLPAHEGSDDVYQVLTFLEIMFLMGSIALMLVLAVVQLWKKGAKACVSDIIARKAIVPSELADSWQTMIVQVAEFDVETIRTIFDAMDGFDLAHFTKAQEIFAALSPADDELHRISSKRSLSMRTSVTSLDRSPSMSGSACSATNDLDLPAEQDI